MPVTAASAQDRPPVGVRLQLGTVLQKPVVVTPTARTQHAQAWQVPLSQWDESELVVRHHVLDGDGFR